MKKLFCTIIILTSVTSLFAGNEKYSVSLYGNYGSNITLGNYLGADIRGSIALNNHLDIAAGTSYTSAGISASTVTVTPVIYLSKGEIFIDGTFNFRNFSNYQIAEFVTAISAGYRAEHISVQLGSFYKGIINRDTDSEGKYIGESPINAVYRGVLTLKPSTSKWNIGIGISNYTEYEYERMWQPMGLIEGRCELNDRLSVNASIYIKQAGFFHQIVSFYGADAKVGVIYQF